MSHSTLSNEGTKKCCNIVLLGDGGTGKTALLNQYINGEFTEEHEPTLLDCLRKDCECIENECYVLNLVDICCDSDFQSQRAAYIRSADLVILTYAANEPTSVENLMSFTKEVVSARARMQPRRDEDGKPMGRVAAAKFGKKTKSKGKKAKKRQYLPELRIPLFFIGTHADVVENEGKNVEQRRALVEKTVLHCLHKAKLELGSDSQQMRPRQDSEENTGSEQDAESNMDLVDIPDGVWSDLPLFELDVHSYESVSSAFRVVTCLHHSYSQDHPRVISDVPGDAEVVPMFTAESISPPKTGPFSFFKRGSKSKNKFNSVSSSQNDFSKKTEIHDHGSDSEAQNMSCSSIPSASNLFRRSNSGSRRSSSSAESDVNSGSVGSEDFALYTSPSFCEKYGWDTNQKRVPFSATATDGGVRTGKKRKNVSKKNQKREKLLARKNDHNEGSPTENRLYRGVQLKVKHNPLSPDSYAQKMKEREKERKDPVTATEEGGEDSEEENIHERCLSLGSSEEPSSTRSSSYSASNQEANDARDQNSDDDEDTDERGEEEPIQRRLSNRRSSTSSNSAHKKENCSLM